VKKNIVLKNKRHKLFKIYVKLNLELSNAYLKLLFTYVIFIHINICRDDYTLI